MWIDTQKRQEAIGCAKNGKTAYGTGSEKDLSPERIGII
jgi:hypothetical protein